MFTFYLTRTSELFGFNKNNTITFNSLEELMQFINANGQVVIQPKDEANGDEYPTLEIYDYWRE